MRECDIQRIFDAVKNRKNIDNFCRVVEKSEIIANEYNLNIPRYVSATPEADKFDLYSVMEGSISDSELSKFDSFWNRFPELKSKLFTRNKGYNTFNNVDIKEVVLSDDKVKAFKESYNVLSNTYRDYMITTLVKEFAKTGKATKDEVVAKLFEIFGNEELVDKYSVYQYLADNWDMIENDLITIRENGIAVCKQTEPNMVLKKDSKTKKTNEVQDGWKGTIMPFDMIEKVFFGQDFETMRELEAQADGFASEYADAFDNLDEDVKKEVSKEEGTTFDSKMLKDKIKDIATPDDVLEILKSAAKAKEQENALRKKIKTISTSLTDKAKEKIESLTDAEIFNLLVYKWIMPVVNGVNST